MVTRLAAGALLIGIGLTTAGCSASSGDDIGNWNDEVRAEYIPEEDPDDERGIPEPEMLLGWSCMYAPSYDDDWHNDVVCRKGAEEHRPHLREWDSFVTQTEIMESAHEYEAELNSGQ